MLLSIPLLAWLYEHRAVVSIGSRVVGCRADCLLGGTLLLRFASHHHEVRLRWACQSTITRASDSTCRFRAAPALLTR